MECLDKSKLKQIRKARKLKLRDVASALNIKVSTLSSYENGWSKPSADMLLTLLAFYQITNYEIAENVV